MTNARTFIKPALKNSLAAVAWFNARADSQGLRLPPRKMQHLLYMAQGLFAAANEGRCLIPSRFIAGSLGPADPNLYPVLEAAEDYHLPKEMDRKAEACLSLIYKKFGDLPIEQLESFVEADGIFADVREAAPDAEIPLSNMASAYRQVFMGDAGTAERNRPAPEPSPAPQPRRKPAVRASDQPQSSSEELPEGVPKVLTGGKTVKRWTPQRRVY